MGLYSAGEVVFLTFPFSDLSSSKRRPAVLLADVANGDWLACQITSNPYIDPTSIPLGKSEFLTGGLPQTSYIRPGKIFTANQSLISVRVGLLTPGSLTKVRDAIILIIRG